MAGKYPKVTRPPSLEIGQRVRIPEHMQGGGQTGRITETAPSGHFHGVSVGKKFIGHYHESDLQPVDSHGNPKPHRVTAVVLHEPHTKKSAADRAHEIVRSQGGTHAGSSTWDESKHPRHPAGQSEGGQFSPGDPVVVDMPGHRSHGKQGEIGSYGSVNRSGEPTHEVLTRHEDQGGESLGNFHSRNLRRAPRRLGK